MSSDLQPSAETDTGHLAVGELQEAVDLWHRWEFPTSDVRDQALVLAEEAGEVARAVVKAHQEIRGGSVHWDAELRKEAADVLIALCAVANKAGFDLAEATAERWAKVRSRQFATEKLRRCTPCECAHDLGSHQTASCFPTPCHERSCPCSGYTIDRKWLSRLDG